MDVYWLEQSEADVREENDWLNPSEVALLDSLRFAKRRGDRRLGLWTAKCALAVCLEFPQFPTTFARIEIRHAPSGAPEVFFDSKPVAVTISLSHRNGRAMCAVAPRSVALGCDLEAIEPHSNAFLTDYFTSGEQWLVARHFPSDRPWILALLWSAKESALKALGEGLKLDTRSVIVRPVEGSLDLNGWNPLQVRYTGGQIFHGWWQKAGDMVRTLVAAPPPASPIRLNAADEFFRRVPSAPNVPLMKAAGVAEDYDVRRKA